MTAEIAHSLLCTKFILQITIMFNTSKLCVRIIFLKITFYIIFLNIIFLALHVFNLSNLLNIWVSYLLNADVVPLLLTGSSQLRANHWEELIIEAN